MITGAHFIIYAHDAELARVFFRDVLGFASVDAGHGWLIFALPPSEIAMHPAEAGRPAANGQPRCEAYLMCDDVRATRTALEKKGVEFTHAIIEQPWGLLTTLKVPGAGEIGLYQPKHPVAHSS